MSALDADAAALLSRQEALRVLSTSPDVSERERRLALLMLDGPEITQGDAQRARRPRLNVMGVAVHAALHEMGGQFRTERSAAAEDIRQLGGGLA